MSRTNKNGLTAARSQPVKPHSKYATHFIAICASIVSAGGMFAICLAVIAVQAVLLLLLGAS